MVADRGAVEVVIDGVPWITTIAMRGVMPFVGRVAFAFVVGDTVSIVAGRFADGKQADVGSLRVEARRRVTVAAVGLDAASSEAARTAQGATAVIHAAVAPALTANRLIPRHVERLEYKIQI